MTDFRELLGGVKQRMEHLELPSEHLSEKFSSESLVGADGEPYRYQRGGYKVMSPYLTECMEYSVKKSGTA